MMPAVVGPVHQITVGETGKFTPLKLILRMGGGTTYASLRIFNSLKVNNFFLRNTDSLQTRRGTLNGVNMRQ